VFENALNIPGEKIVDVYKLREADS